MTDTQQLRKKISQKCIEVLEKKTQKGRISIEEIEKTITLEIQNAVKEELSR